MKTRTWILLLAFLLAASIALSVFLLQPGQAARAEIWSDGQLLYTLELSISRTVTVQSVRGTNTVTVRDGKIAVTGADCPDHYCMHRGFCAGGAQIVCLPNRLVIRFVDTQEIDSVTG